MIMEPQQVQVVEDRVFHPRRRAGTKNFSDVPLDVRKKELAGPVGQYLERILPAEIWEAFKTAILDSGIESKEAMKWLDYALSEDEAGKPISPVAREVAENPFDPQAFKLLYGIEDARSPLDASYVQMAGAHAIYLRLNTTGTDFGAVFLLFFPCLHLNCSIFLAKVGIETRDNLDYF